MKQFKMFSVIVSITKTLLLIIKILISFQLDNIQATTSKLPDWNNEVFTGDHLDELVLEERGYFTINVVLVIYGRKCQSKLRILNISTKSLPPSNFLLFCKYNYDKANQDMWLEMDDDMDLKKRYGTKECLDVLLFKRGMKRETQPIRWEPSPDENFQEWAWKKLSVQVTVTNQLQSPVAVYFESLAGDSPELDPVYFLPGTAQVINTYPSYVAMIYATEALGSGIKDPKNKFIEARVVRLNAKVTVSSIPEKQKYSGQAFLDVLREKHQKEVDKYTKYLTAHSHRSQLNVRQPPFLPVLSKQGYEIVSYSRDLQGKLITYFQQFSEKLNAESVCNEYGVIVNPDKHEYYCDTIKINKKLQLDIVQETNKIASKFCNCAVKLVSVNNITVYGPSSVVYRHVDKPDRAAITVVVVIIKDMNKNIEPWITEITNLEGNKVNIDLNMREALVYESAQSIMGRPRPLKGYAHVELKVQYVPYRSWPFAHDKIVSYISEGKIKGIRAKVWKEGQGEYEESENSAKEEPAKGASTPTSVDDKVLEETQETSKEQDKINAESKSSSQTAESGGRESEVSDSDVTKSDRTIILDKHANASSQTKTVSYAKDEL